MSTYLFYPPADKAQDDIWRYTSQKWGEKQAEKYIMGLHSHLQALSEKKKFWHKLPNSLVIPPDLDIQAYFSQYEHHHLFFRPLSDDRIGVMSILHEKSDMPIRLCRDLNKIAVLNPVTL